MVPQGRLLWRSRGRSGNGWRILPAGRHAILAMNVQLPSAEPHHCLMIHATKHRSAWTEVWTDTCRSGASIMAPGGRSGQIFEIFEILGGAGDINNSISMLNYCNEPLSDLGGHVNKVLSAWTEVWSGTCRSSRRFCFPEVVILTDFCDSGRGRGWRYQ